MAKRSLSRPNTATPKHPLSDLDKSKVQFRQFLDIISVVRLIKTYKEQAGLQGKDTEAVQGAKKKLYDGTTSATSRIASASARGKGI